MRVFFTYALMRISHLFTARIEEPLKPEWLRFEGL